jgi:hypothetical protein
VLGLAGIAFPALIGMRYLGQRIKERQRQARPAQEEARRRARRTRAGPSN